jgi:hypothetical protein
MNVSTLLHKFSQSSFFEKRELYFFFLMEGVQARNWRQTENGHAFLRDQEKKPPSLHIHECLRLCKKK